jgi:hypothetical protein
MLAQEDGARVGHALQAALGHGEHADLVDRAEAVLDGAHQAKGRMRFAFEVQHRVHHVLEHARARERALFRDVAHQHHGRAAGLGKAREVGRAFAHLRHRAGGGGELVGVHRLDRVDHRDGRARGVERGNDLLELDLGQHLHLRMVQPEPLGAQRHLRAAFFTRDIERVLPRALQRIDRLQQQRRLADAGVAADERHAARDDAAAQHAVELVEPGGRARDVGRLDVGQRRELGGARQRRELRAEAVVGRRRPLSPQPVRRGCSMHRNSGICPATWGWCRRIHCRRKVFCPWPCDEFRCPHKP